MINGETVTPNACLSCPDFLASHFKIVSAVPVIEDKIHLGWRVGPCVCQWSESYEEALYTKETKN